METVGMRTFRPLRTNNGSTSDETFNDVSATNRRSAGEARNRRGRATGNPGKFMQVILVSNPSEQSGKFLTCDDRKDDRAGLEMPPV
jgi:hypothetical protein